MLATTDDEPNRAKHAPALPVGPTAAKEGDEDSRDRDNQDEDDCTVVDRNTGIGLELARLLSSKETQRSDYLVKKIKEGRSVHHHPGTKAHHYTGQYLGDD